MIKKSKNKIKQKTQILFIHGGMTFLNKKAHIEFLKNRPIKLENTKSWKEEYLRKELKNMQIIKPKMPCPDNAKYKEWKIFFERYFPHINDNVILIGESLGGIFLAKYLSENKFPKKILSVYLVCPPHSDDLPNERLSGGFKIKSNLSLLEKQSKNLTLMFSKDDDVVPINHAEKYREKLKYAKIIIYKSKKGHFKISKFPEIIRMIKQNIN